MVNIGLFSDLIGSLLYLILSILLLINWRGHLIGGMLIASCLISTIWFSISAYYYSGAGTYFSVTWLQAIEIMRDFSWLMFLYVLLKQWPKNDKGRGTSKLLPVIISVISLLLLVAVIKTPILQKIYIGTIDSIRIIFIGFLFLSLFALLMIENFYRETRPESRWAIKFLCIGMGGIFIYDLYLYSEALLFLRINADIYHVRGIVNGLCVPLIAISVARNPDWKIDLFVSRHIIYQSTTTVAVGVYLIIMAIAGYYVRNFGGTWGAALQTIFFFGAIMVLAILLFSSDLRAKLKVVLAKHFYRNKYDYREEWLGFTRNMAENRNDAEIYKTIIKAMSGILKSPGGAIWVSDSDKGYRLADTWNLSVEQEEDIPENSRYIEFMKRKRWIIDLDEYRAKPDRYDDINLPDWLVSGNKNWLIVPLISSENLIGFIILLRPYIKVSFDWEDRDLLNTVGYQIASYITLLKVKDELAEIRQFETFSRLSAFVVHDLKNIIAQFSLITSNAKKFRDNPEFLDDAFETVDNAVAKMERLLANLRKGERFSGQVQQKLDLEKIIREIVESRKFNKPVPHINGCDSSIIIGVERDKLEAVLGHLIQNAQDATQDNGRIEIVLRNRNDLVEIDIADNGCGMDADFIKNRLFKPFDTTKGNAGMGIGVYESREIIREMGGALNVFSKPGEGTRFTITLPAMSETNIKNKVLLGI